MSILHCACVVMVHVLVLLIQQTCYARSNHSPCPPSSCGKIHNITHPFRLKGDPSHCGLHEYELECVNNVTVLKVFSGTYHVQEIDYKRYGILLIDAGVVEDTACSIPRYLFKIDFNNFFSPWALYTYNVTTVGFLNCTNLVTNYHRYVHVNGGSCNSGDHVYAFLLNDYWELTMKDIKDGCRLKAATLANRNNDEIGHRKVSYVDIRRWLNQGFWLSWLSQVICNDVCGSESYPCYFNETIQQAQCIRGPSTCQMFNGIPIKCGIKSEILEHIRLISAYLKGIIVGFVRRITFRIKLTQLEIGQNIIGESILPLVLGARCVFGVTLVLVLYINMWRRRNVSLYDNIENFLLDNNVNPIRYEYREIKKMTQGFKVILGRGGFGYVYKGKLRSGSNVAIKMLNKSKTNGQDFISEVATIGRIHHVNVVRLIGYCVEGKKRALVYEYMSNGSLDKYIFSKEGSVPLSYKKIYEISLEIARGIAYLHEGCDVQILHFDIKPHNILLDDNFVSKISDFGLAKLYPTKDRSIILTAIRGTLGYMAPELFYQNIGGVSYKADVYSFGMLLMEMGSGRRNSNPHAEHSSQHYFPFWIYDQFQEEKDIDIEDASKEDKILLRKMFIVSLWCIQLKPNDRPSMTKVVEMLEGEVESLGMPPKPIFVPNDETITNDGISSYQTSWSDDSTSFNKNLGKIN